MFTSNENEKVYGIDLEDSAGLDSGVEKTSTLGVDATTTTTAIPKYKLKSQYLSEFPSIPQADFIQTPVLDPVQGREIIEGLTVEQAEATLAYFISCGDRLSQMTKTYHDVEAVTSLLQEKENDLELAAKIGQELLERNRRLEERVNGLEIQLSSSTELITQLRYDLTIKTDLLHVYTNDAIEDSSPLDSKNVNVGIMERKIRDLEDENKKLQSEAAELAKEAFECEAKEEKLVTDAVKHLTEANVQINYLSEENFVKSNESHKQKEEITYLLAQVCDLQSKLKESSGENTELTANLRIYKETQDDLTSELADFKEKYREIVELLHDTRHELKQAKKRTYPGVGEHKVSEMFSESSQKKEKIEGDGKFSLESEIQSSIRSTSKFPPQQKSSILDRHSSDSDELDIAISSRSNSNFKNTFQTFKIGTANKMHIGGMCSDSPIPIYNPGLGSSYERPKILPYANDDAYSYTISRDDSRSPTTFLLDLEDTSLMTSDTLTMVPAGSHQRQRSSSMYDDTSGFLESILEKNKAHLQNEADDECSIPDLSSNPSHNKYQSLPGLAQINIEEDEHTFEPIDPMDDNFVGFRKQLDHKNFGSLSSIPKFIGGGTIPASSVSGYFGTNTTNSSNHLVSTTESMSIPRPVASIKTGQRNIREDLGTIPSGPFLNDSGVESSEFIQHQDLASHFPQDNFGSHATSGGGSGSIPELEEALSKLTPEDVEKRRRMFNLGAAGPRYSMDLGSDGYESPGSALMGRPGFGNFMPYGIRTPDSLMSTGSRDFASSAYGAGWKLPDKLRIIKPMEGSLTLHNWQQLAMPSLGGIFEERKGVMMRSRLRNMSVHDAEILSDIESDNNEDEAQVKSRLKMGAEKLRNFGGDNTRLTSSYGAGSRMSTSLFSSRDQSRRSSICSSMEDLRLVYGNIGLSNVIQERNIHGGSSLSLDHSRYGSMTDLKTLRNSGISRSDVASISSLTPSVMHSPNKDKTFSPTGTPLNSPIASRSASPERPKEESEPGMVLGFFASLRAALYGEQQKEVKTLRRKHKKTKRDSKKPKLGILEKVQEVGPERFLSPARGLTEDEGSEVGSDEILDTKVKVKYFQDFDELIDIQPGSLTLGSGGTRSSGGGVWNPDLFGELRPPGENANQSGRGPGRVVSPGDKRPTLPGGFGVPGKTGTGALKRSDLGTIPLDMPGAMSSISGSGYNPEAKFRLHSRPDDRTSEGFIGTLTTMFFGRKGGLL